MQFKYIAYDKNNAKLKGIVEFDTQKEALEHLKSLDYRILKLTVYKKSSLQKLSGKKVNLSMIGFLGRKKRIKQFESFREELDIMGYDSYAETKTINKETFDVEHHREHYDLTPIQLEKINTGRTKALNTDSNRRKNFAVLEKLNPFGRIGLKDLITFTEQLSILLKTNVILTEALETIQVDIGNEKFKLIIDNILYDLNKGHEFSIALEAHPTIFTPLYVSMVRVGETTGSELPNTLNDLVTFLKMNLRLKREFMLAMIYPISVLIALVGLLFFVSKFVMPRLMQLFNGNRFTIPPFTEFIFMVASNLGTIFFVTAIVVSLVVFAVMRVDVLRIAFTNFMDMISLKIPLLNKLLITRFMYQISLTLSVTLRSGISITDSLELIHNIIGNIQLKANINAIYYGLEKGRSISDMFREQPHLENLLKMAVSAGDKSGMLSETLETVADYYDKELTNRIETLVQILVPTTIVFLALVTAPFIIGIYLPIVSLTQQIGNM